MTRYSDDEHVNVGSGEDLTIAQLAMEVCRTVGLTASLAYDLSKPDGTARKLMSGQKLRDMGWSPSIKLQDGIAQTYRWFLDSAMEGVLGASNRR